MIIFFARLIAAVIVTHVCCLPARRRPCPLRHRAIAVIIKDDDDDGDGSSPFCRCPSERARGRAGPACLGGYSSQGARSLLLSLSGGLIASVITICAVSAYDDDDDDAFDDEREYYALSFPLSHR